MFTRLERGIICIIRNIRAKLMRVLIVRPEIRSRPVKKGLDIRSRIDTCFVLLCFSPFYSSWIIRSHVIQPYSFNGLIPKKALKEHVFKVFFTGWLCGVSIDMTSRFPIWDISQSIDMIITREYSLSLNTLVGFIFLFPRRLLTF